MDKKTGEEIVYPDDYINKVICGDCLEVMKGISDNSVDLVITSPPYNKGYYDKHTPHPADVWRQRNIKYGDFADNLKPKEYIKQQTKVLQELVRIIKKEGSIFYNTKSVIANHKLIYPTFVFDFNVRQQIIWDRNSTPQLAPIRFLPTTEYIFWITKTNTQPKFQREIIKYKKEIWQLPVKQCPEHPAPFPEELPVNCILATTDENDIVVDPFIGIGTTAVACKQLNRKFIGIEINPDYCRIARERLMGIPDSLFKEK